MKKNVFRTFDFVVRQTDEIKKIQQNWSNLIFYPVLAVYKKFPWDIIRLRYRLLKKSRFFPKMKVMPS